jgi:hypothetical protein
MSMGKLTEILQDWLDRILGGTGKDQLAAWSERAHKALTLAHSMVIGIL